MIYNFQALIEDISPRFKGQDKIDSHIILDYLNRTQDRYIKLKYFSGNSFKQNTFKISAMLDEFPDLITMTDTAIPPLFTQVPGMPVGTTLFVSKPADMLGYIRADIEVSRTVVLPFATKWIPMEEIDYNDIDGVLTTPFNIPILEVPLITYLSDLLASSSKNAGFIVVIDAHTTPSNLMVTYMKKPQEISESNECQLADRLHEEIVKLAVSMYIDEYKTKLQPKKG